MPSPAMTAMRKVVMVTSRPRPLGKGTSTHTKPPTNADLASEYAPSRSQSGPRLGEPMAGEPSSGLELRAPQWVAAGTVRYASAAGTEAAAPGPLVLDFDQG